MEPIMWQVATANSKSFEHLHRPGSAGVRRIRRRGRAYVPMTEEDLERREGKPTKISIGEDLVNAPRVEWSVIERDRSLPREFDVRADDE
jgi:hypothetical protein